MNAKQISSVKRDYRYFEARNRCELPGMPANIEACRYQARRLWAQLAPQLRDSGAWTDFVIESDFVDTIANELYSDIMQDHGLLEQQEAVDEVTNAQKTLMAVLHHHEVPVDITDECEGVDKCYRNYYVDDISAEVHAAFLMWNASMYLHQKRRLHLAKDPTVVIMVTADGVTNYTPIELQRISNVQTLDLDYQIGEPTACKLALAIKKQLDKPVYDSVEIAFKIMG